MIGGYSQMQTPAAKKLKPAQLFGSRRSKTAGSLIENEWEMKKWKPSLIPVARYT